MNEENELRARRIMCAATAVEAYRDNMEDPDQLAADLLADLRHFCDIHGLDFAALDRQGRAAYLEELEEPTA
jgi:hypothetical protein